MISITIEELLNSSEGLKSLSEKSLKARPALMIGRILKAVDAELNNFNETRMNLITKYGEKDEKGELIKDEKENVHILQENITDFNKELAELLDVTIELNINKINLDDIGDIDFTPLEMSQLEKFIDIKE